MQPMQDFLHRTYLTSSALIILCIVIIVYTFETHKQHTLFMSYDKKFMNEEETTNVGWVLSILQFNVCINYIIHNFYTYTDILL